jgi:hypothetical protein
MADVLRDSDATPAALQFADFLLSLVYDRSRLRAIAHGAPPSSPVDFPDRELGQHAGLIKLAIQYATLLALLEKKGLGSGIRKFLGGYDPVEPEAEARISSPAGERAVSPLYPAWAANAVSGFVHSPQGRVYENAIEGQAMACAA